MRTITSALLIAVMGCLLASCVSTTPTDEAWKKQLNANLSVLGARNWIVIAESSYPSYTGAGVTTISTEQDSAQVFLQVLDSLERSGYLKPRIMVCSELRGVDEAYAPGIKRYRNQINKLLPGRLHFELPSRVINGQIEDAAKQFKVLVIKTSTALPYSNIYIELDSGYWNTDSETALRTKLESRDKRAADPSGQTPVIPLPVNTSPGTKVPTPTPVNTLPELPHEDKVDTRLLPSAPNSLS